MKKISLISFLLGAISASCQSSGDSTVIAIIGDDSRSMIESNSTLYEVVGFFMAPGGPCKAIATGPYEITTAGHCYDAKLGQPDSHLFALADQSMESEQLEYISYDSDQMVARLKTKVRLKSHLSVGLMPGVPLQVVLEQPQLSAAFL